MVSNNTRSILAHVDLKIYETKDNKCDGLGKLKFTKLISNITSGAKEEQVISESKGYLWASVKYEEYGICDVRYTMEGGFFPIFMNIGEFNGRDCKSITFKARQ
jgi:hypothetical protein